MSVCLWLVLAITGIASFVYAVGSVWFDWAAPVDAWLLTLVAVLLPFASAPLWGRQFGASLVRSERVDQRRLVVEPLTVPFDVRQSCLRRDSWMLLDEARPRDAVPDQVGAE